MTRRLPLPAGLATVLFAGRKLSLGERTARSGGGAGHAGVIRGHNVVLVDFVLKCGLRSNGHPFGRSVFETRAFLTAA